MQTSSCPRTHARPLITLLTLTVFLFVVLPGFGRTWTNHKGQQLEGDFVGYANGTVTIDPDNRDGTVEISLDKLSAADQDYVLQQVAGDDDGDLADTSDTEADEELKGFLQIMALGFGVLIVAGLIFSIVMFLVRALFIHMATRIMNFGGGFGTACMAQILEMVFGAVSTVILLPIAYVLGQSDAVGALPVVALLLTLVLSPLGIKIAYSESFGASLVAWILSGILSAIAGIALLVLLIFGLMMVAGGMAS